MTVAWDGTGDADVAQYLVHYGNVAGALGGTGAAQGPSPVAVGAFPGNAAPSFTLTGLTPGLPYYVAIEAVDAAGNRSGPSGERLAVPARANPRVLSTFFGQPRALATVVETFDDAIAANDRTYAYLGENQGFVQLDVSSDTVAPPVIGRAHVPDFVPDARNGVVAFRCAKGAVKGHCVVAAGATLEGDYRDDVDRYRASAPIVFFPTGGTVAAPTIGTVEGVLPGRPSFVFAIPSSQPGETLLYTVDARTVRAFSMPAGQLSRLREVASVEYGFGLVQSRPRGHPRLLRAGARTCSPGSTCSTTPLPSCSPSTPWRPGTARCTSSRPRRRSSTPRPRPSTCSATCATPSRRRSRR